MVGNLLTQSQYVIKVEGLHKKFCKSLRKSMLYGSTDLIYDFIGMPKNSDKLRPGEFWGLEDINFELKKGETLGLIGQNGCGKTTLLRLINGIFPPDKGRITINGRIGALIAVGAGFHPHMTGRENIYLNGSILGMKRAEINANLDSIIDFADIGEFIDSPVSNYSSGMTIRLGFSIAIHVRPNIVLVDEILAVGDTDFQLKCMDKIKEMMRRDETSFIVVSHNLSQIERICSKSILMNRGRMLDYGCTENIVKKYYQLISLTHKESQTSQISELLEDLAACAISKNRNFVFGDDLSFEVSFFSNTNFDDAEFRFAISLKENNHYIAFTTSRYQYTNRPSIKKGFQKVQITIQNPKLLPNSYSLHFSIANNENIYLVGKYNILEFEIMESLENPIEAEAYSGLIALTSKIYLSHE